MRIGSLVYLPRSSPFSGRSSSSGFVIIRGESELVRSKNYEEEDSTYKFKKRHCVFWGIIWFFSVLLWVISLLYNEDASFWTELFSLLVAAALLSYTCRTLTTLLFFSGIMGKDLVEYHACEHKVVALLLEKELEPTIENLKKMPRVTSECGSMRLAPFGILPSGICLQYAVVNWLWSSQVTLPVILVETLLFIILMVVSPFLIQFFCVTAKPSQEKLEEALKVAKEFKEFYE